MKRILIILLLAVAAFPAFAQMGSPIIIPIWPDGAPNDNGIVTEEGHPSPRSVDNVSKPELWVFPAFRPNGTVIIACPGGGYYYLEIEKEGTGLAPWFNYIGVTLAVLKYRMPNGHFPLQEGNSKSCPLFFASIIPVFNGKGHDKPASPVIVGIQLKAAAKQDYVTFCQRKS